jgi:hypothetical protein
VSLTASHNGSHQSHTSLHSVQSVGDVANANTMHTQTASGKLSFGLAQEFKHQPRAH